MTLRTVRHTGPTRSARLSAARFLTRLAAVAALGGAAVVAAQAAPVNYQVDPTHTFATFGVRHFGTSTMRGRFDKTEGSVMLDLAARKGSADITIAIDSVSTGVAELDGHLKKDDFFNTGKYPTARFVSSAFVFAGAKPTAVTGQLTMLGQTHPVKLKVTNFRCYDNPMVKKEVCGGDLEATIKRSVWGMTSNAPFVGDDIQLSIQVEAVRQ